MISRQVSELTKQELTVVTTSAESYPAGYGSVYFAIDEMYVPCDAQQSADALEAHPEWLQYG